MQINKLPAFPPGEQKDQHDDERKRQSAWNDDSFARGVTPILVVKRNQNGEYIAAHMPPSKHSDSWLAEHIDQTNNGRECGHHEART
jgi:hypothetical protein